MAKDSEDAIRDEQAGNEAQGGQAEGGESESESQSQARLAEELEDAVDGGGWPPEKLRPVLEAVLFASADPVPIKKLAEIIDGATRLELGAALSSIEEDFKERGFRLVQVAGGWQLRTAPEHQSIVRKMFKERPFRLTRAALETLAIVAYRQPITRAEVESVRGVDCSGVLESLVERKVVRVAGRRDVPGRPLVYATTPTFLEMFGLKDLKSLPTLSELGDEFINMADQAGFGAGEDGDAAVLPLEDEDGEEHALARQHGQEAGDESRDDDFEGAQDDEQVLHADEGRQVTVEHEDGNEPDAAHEHPKRRAGQGDQAEQDDEGVPKIRFRPAADDADANDAEAAEDPARRFD
jgi:segregation and condensation protein B